MDYGHGVSLIHSGIKWTLMIDPLMGNLFTGILLPLLDMMVPNLLLPMYVLILLSSRLVSTSAHDHWLTYRFPFRSPLVLPIPSS
jgi:hypothetical protein